MSVNSCNVSYKSKIDAEILVGILSGRLSAQNWKSHLDTFFNELPQTHILGVIEENQLSLSQITKVFEALPAVFQGKNFKGLL